MSLHEMQLQRTGTEDNTSLVLDCGGNWHMPVTKGFSRIYLGNSPFEDLVLFVSTRGGMYLPFLFWNFTKLHFPENFWKFPSWWFQPIWKICQSKWVHLPSSRDENKKYLSCHHPVRNHHPVSLMKNHHLGWPRLRFFHAQIWSSHTEASRPFDFSSQRTGFHLSSQGWVCWLMNSFIELIYSFIYLLIHWLIYVLIYWLIDWLIDWLVGWLIDWLIDCLIDCLKLLHLQLHFGLMCGWITIWPNCKWNHDSGGEASKQPKKET